MERLKLAITRSVQSSDVQATREAFNFFDKNNDNRISKDEVYQVLNRFGGEVFQAFREGEGGPGHLDQASLELSFNSSDANADGFLDFEEFRIFLNRVSY